MAKWYRFFSSSDYSRYIDLDKITEVTYNQSLETLTVSLGDKDDRHHLTKADHPEAYRYIVALLGLS